MDNKIYPSHKEQLYTPNFQEFLQTSQTSTKLPRRLTNSRYFYLTSKTFTKFSIISTLTFGSKLYPGYSLARRYIKFMFELEKIKEEELWHLYKISVPCYWKKSVHSYRPRTPLTPIFKHNSIIDCFQKQKNELCLNFDESLTLLSRARQKIQHGIV